jgi:hypothetical protein
MGWPENHSEAHVDAGAAPATGARKVRTERELADVVAAPTGVAPVRTVWIREGLEEAARRLWDRGRMS